MASQPDGTTASTTAEPSGDPSAGLQQIEIGGEAKVVASISMLYTDILSQEINSQLSTPDSVSLLQKHLQNKSLEQLNSHELAPLMESIPESLLDLAREAAFSSGALLKRIPCRMPLNVGDVFHFRGSGLIAELELKDGRVTSIKPWRKA